MAMNNPEFNKLAFKNAVALSDMCDMLMPPNATEDSPWFKARLLSKQLKKEAERRVYVDERGI